MNWRQAIRNILPQCCFLCGGPTREAGFCDRCLADLPWLEGGCPCCREAMSVPQICGKCQQNPPAFTRVEGLFRYDFPVNKLIVAGKFHEDLATLAVLGRLMARRIHIPVKPDVLIPVPLHKKRLRNRGYNQSMELAKPIARTTGIPLDSSVCERIRNTRPQVGLSGEDRRKNVRGAFKTARLDPAWRYVVLIDDVITSGRTVREIAKIFVQAGVQRVD
ncbi:MAG: ComF family protein, partial [Gammaproteobacteria bacterium]|nr:ComF family protein [Gammaproteobacteria bacterium]